MNYRPFLIGVLVILSGCAGGGVIDPMASSIMPLAFGNHWTYEITDSKACQCTKEITLQDTLRLDGTSWYVTPAVQTITLPHDSVVLIKSYSCGERPDGLWVMIPGWPSPELVAKYPASAGDRYMVGASFLLVPYESDSLTAVVSTTDTLISTQSGNYHCFGYNYFFRDGALLQTDYYSPGTGLVQEFDNLYHRRLDLISVSLH